MSGDDPLLETFIAESREHGIEDGKGITALPLSRVP